GALGDGDRVPGPERLSLLDEHRGRFEIPRPDRLHNSVLVATDHDRQRRGSNRPGGLEYVPECGPPTALVQDLGALGLHPLALAGCQHDGGNRAGRLSGGHLGLPFLEGSGRSFVPAGPADRNVRPSGVNGTGSAVSWPEIATGPSSNRQDAGFWSRKSAFESRGASDSHTLEPFAVT